jgi:two-component system chemotaxis response regulator CheB
LAQIRKYKAVVVGSSAGGLKALKLLFKGLSPAFKMPVIIVQHI